MIECGSCAVWTLRPLSAACQDVASLVRYPVSVSVCMSVCVCLLDRESLE